MDLKNYLEQHEAVMGEITEVQTLIETQELEKNARDIGLHISMLAGKIKIHLSMEDKYLYPRLQEQGSEQVKKIADYYQKEMGNLASQFAAYKDKYNTSHKILQNLSSFKSDTIIIFQAIEKRVQREEKELYKFI